MKNNLLVEAGQCSQAGIKEQNEDCCGIQFPQGMELTHKGIVAAIADGVGSGEAGRESSEYCVKGFIGDYYSTPHSWTVQTSGERVIASLNSWLYSHGQRSLRSELGLASTLSILILKSTTAHLFHVGDSRIWLIRDGELQCLTQDHRLRVNSEKNYLTRAMGADYNVRIDYQSLDLHLHDIFVLTTDGLHEFVSQTEILKHAIASEGSWEDYASNLVTQAIQAGSLDNVSCQILKVTQLPNQNVDAYYRQLTQLPFPPPLSSGMTLDGYRIVKELHTSVTIQVYLAEDLQTKETVVIKTPSINFEDDPAYIDRFVHEEWVGQRIDNPHVFKVHPLKHQRSCLYYVTEFLEGQSLAQWILDHPEPELEEVRDIVKQVIQGLRGFHRKEMVHQDIKPENIMMDRHGIIKIIDFGSTLIAGLKEIYTPVEQNELQGTANYIAPELFEGYLGTPKSDLYSLGVTVYEMLSGGHFPYGNNQELRKPTHFHYISLRKYNSKIPVWVDGAIQKAVHPQPEKRTEVFSEFQYDLSHPNPAFMKDSAPLLERDPLLFWKGLALLLALSNLVTLFTY